MLPPLYNSPGLSAIAGNAIRKLFGDHIRRDMPPVMASEDFACLTENIPGLYINIGCANKQLGFTENNYSSRFMGCSIIGIGCWNWILFGCIYWNLIYSVCTCFIKKNRCLY